MDAVASAGGVSKNTVYSHFASKEALFGAVIAHEVDRASALFGQRVPASLPMPTALRLLAGAYQRIVLEDKAVRIFRTVIGESVAHPDVAQLFAESAATMTQRVFETFIAERAAAGELSMDAAEIPAAASLLQTLLRGELHTRALMNLAPPTDAEREAQLTQAITAFERLYAPHSPHQKTLRNNHQNEAT